MFLFHFGLLQIVCFRVVEANRGKCGADRIQGLRVVF